MIQIKIKSLQNVCFYILLSGYKKGKSFMKYVGQKLSIAVQINIVLISNIWNVLFLFERNDMIFHICNWSLFLFLFSFRKVWWSSQKTFNHAVKGFDNSFLDFILYKKYFCKGLLGIWIVHEKTSITSNHKK